MERETSEKHFRLPFFSPRTQSSAPKTDLRWFVEKANFVLIISFIAQASPNFIELNYESCRMAKDENDISKCLLSLEETSSSELWEVKQANNNKVVQQVDFESNIIALVTMRVVCLVSL